MTKIMKIDEFVRYDGTPGKAKDEYLDILFQAMSLTLDGNTSEYKRLINAYGGGQLFIVSGKTIGGEVGAAAKSRFLEANHIKNIDELKDMFLRDENIIVSLDSLVDCVLNSDSSVEYLAAFLKTNFNGNGFAEIDGNEFHGMFLIYVEGTNSTADVVNRLRKVFGVPTASAIQARAYIV